MYGEQGFSGETPQQEASHKKDSGALISLDELRSEDARLAAEIAEAEGILRGVKDMGAGVTPDAKSHLAELKKLHARVREERMKAEEFLEMHGADSGINPAEIKRLRPEGLDTSVDGESETRKVA